MSQPVRLSDELVVDARRIAEVSARSIAGQIEFWADLGRAIEPLIEGSRALALRRTAKAEPLSQSLATIGTDEGHRRLSEYLKSTPFPHFEPVPGDSALLIRIEADGTRTIGRFVDREFQAIER